MMYKSQLYIKNDPYDWFCGPGSHLCFEDEQKSFEFDMTWVWVNNKIIFFLGVNIEIRCAYEMFLRERHEIIHRNGQISSAETQLVSASMI